MCVLQVNLLSVSTPLVRTVVLYRCQLTDYTLCFTGEPAVGEHPLGVNRSAVPLSTDGLRCVCFTGEKPLWLAL